MNLHNKADSDQGCAQVKIVPSGAAILHGDREITLAYVIIMHYHVCHCMLDLHSKIMRPPCGWGDGSLSKLAIQHAIPSKVIQGHLLCAFIWLSLHVRELVSRTHGYSDYLGIVSLHGVQSHIIDVCLGYNMFQERG